MGVCEGLLAKLNELMDFLRFAKLPSAEFCGVVRGLAPKLRDFYGLV
jgi:hypothetical protein